MKKLLFEESQKNVYLMAIVPAVFVGILFGTLAVIQIGFHKQMGNHPAPGWLLVCISVFSFAGIILFSMQKLKLVITEDEIYVSFGLFSANNIIRLSDIKNISIRKYDALKEFWGWGVRFNSSGTCYTVSGDTALEITLNNNQKVLIGTQQGEQLQKVINNLLVRR